MSFKKGDRVIVIDNSLAPSDVKIGDTGVMQSEFEIKIDRTGQTWFTNKSKIVKYNEEVYNPYDGAVNELKQLYDSLVKFGFSEKRSWSLIRSLIKESVKNNS